MTWCGYTAQRCHEASQGNCIALGPAHSELLGSCLMPPTAFIIREHNGRSRFVVHFDRLKPRPLNIRLPDTEITSQTPKRKGRSPTPQPLGTELEIPDIDDPIPPPRDPIPPPRYPTRNRQPPTYFQQVVSH